MNIIKPRKSNQNYHLPFVILPQSIHSPITSLYGQAIVHNLAYLLQNNKDRNRPFKCSKCGLRSNWKWDVTKHIRMFHADMEPLPDLIILDPVTAANTPYTPPVYNSKRSDVTALVCSNQLYYKYVYIFLFILLSLLFTYFHFFSLVFSHFLLVSFCFTFLFNAPYLLNLTYLTCIF